MTFTSTMDSGTNLSMAFFRERSMTSSSFEKSCSYWIFLLPSHGRPNVLFPSRLESHQIFGIRLSPILHPSPLRTAQPFFSFPNSNPTEYLDIPLFSYNLPPLSLAVKSLIDYQLPVFTSPSYPPRINFIYIFITFREGIIYSSISRACITCSILSILIYLIILEYAGEQHLNFHYLPVFSYCISICRNLITNHS